MSKRVCIYCASSTQIAQAYFEHAQTIASRLVDGDHHIVYGGGAVGLMGAVADTVIAKGGRITGVIPQFMKEVEWDHPGVTDMIFTETMAERKELLLKDAHVALALPGGSGTFEEIFEAITMKRLAQISTTIVFYNQNGYYNPMKAMLEKSVYEKFMTPQHMEQINFFDDIDTLINFINTHSSNELLDINAAVVR